jgi:hypothetical protein
MRLPSSLLGCVRVGVGVGAVMLGGCDVVSEAKARVFGEEQAEVAAQAEAEAPVAEAEAPVAPAPMLLTRGGVAGVVEETVARSEAAPAVAPVPPVQDLGRRFAPEGSPAFVPYDGGVGALASAPASGGRTVAPAKPRPRAKPRAARPDEPCEPTLATAVEPPDTGWQCGPCGRG